MSLAARPTSTTRRGSRICWGTAYARAQFYRLKSRRGPSKAIIAVAASMLVAIYHMLRKEVPYRDLGADHFESRGKERIVQACVRRLQHLGYKVELQQAA